MVVAVAVAAAAAAVEEAAPASPSTVWVAVSLHRFLLFSLFLLLLLLRRLTLGSCVFVLFTGGYFTLSLCQKYVVLVVDSVVVATVALPVTIITATLSKDRLLLLFRFAHSHKI